MTMKKYVILVVVAISALCFVGCEENILAEFIAGRWDTSVLTADITCPTLGYDKIPFSSYKQRLKLNHYRTSCGTVCHSGMCRFTYYRYIDNDDTDCQYTLLRIRFAEWDKESMELHRRYDLTDPNLALEDSYVYFGRDDNAEFQVTFDELEEGYIIFTEADSSMYNSPYQEDRVILLSGEFHLKFRGCLLENGRFENIECFYDAF